MSTYAIKDWNRVFEDFRSREVKELEFVKMPVGRHRESFMALVGSPGGLAAYGVFCVLVTIAAACPVRGTLSDDKGPWTPKRFAARFHVKASSVESAIRLLMSPEVRWLEIIDGASTAHRPSIDPMQDLPEPLPEPRTITPPADRTGGGMPLIPASLRAPLFSSAWVDWLKHRQEIRKPMRPTGAAELLRQFEEWGVDRSVAAIRYTILKGWQGIREPDGAAAGSAFTPTPREDFDGCLPGETTLDALIRKGKVKA